MIESSDDRERLLRHARDTATRALGGRADTLPDRPVVAGRFGGVFVTLWRGRMLRGCMGTFTATTDIAATVEEMTRSSLKDPRFKSHPVLAGELPGLCIEISVLSDRWHVDDPLTLTPGVHGVVVRQGGRSGCFLPKVATERGWSMKELLEHCCTSKAGIATDAWKAADAEVLAFTAEALRETAEA